MNIDKGWGSDPNYNSGCLNFEWGGGEGCIRAIPRAFVAAVRAMWRNR